MLCPVIEEGGVPVPKAVLNVMHLWAYRSVGNMNIPPRKDDFVI